MGDPHWAFHPFSIAHAAVLLLFAAATALLVVLGRRWRGTRRQTRLEHALGWTMLALWAISNVWWLAPSRFDPARSLPLQVCDITSLTAGLVLLAPRRWLRALLYFWGIVLSVQALITPDLREGLDSVWFWMFWATHAGSVGVAVYDVAVRGFRPTWRDYWIAAAAAAVYLAVVLAVNLRFGFNYGYVGEGRPGQPSVIDFLGPWPERVVVIAALVAVAMALLVLPWRPLRRPVPRTTPQPGRRPAPRG